MTRIVATPGLFAADAAAGFVDAYADLVRAVQGGVIRATATPAGKVAVVTGGGSGHYPLFAGYVGAGLADAAVMGDVFASPSSRAVIDVATAASRGGGVLLTFGNYAGDVLNFSAAADALRALGIDTRIVLVTDDVASAPPNESHRRRGVAGGVVVFKVAGAAAEAGANLEAVTGIAARANERTRSLGLAFAGCTLPGASAPLFTLPPGMMGVGMGIHGEPGVSDAPIVPAEDLARLLVDRLLAEAPANGGLRVAAILNGLGATKHEELFVLWRFVAPMLRAAGLTLVAPQVGEFVTSLDMAGCSLTITWLDEELERLWLAPAHAPAFRRGDAVGAGVSAEGRVEVPLPVAVPAPAAPVAWPASTSGSRDGAALIARCLAAALTDVREAEDALGRLDAEAGDGDHGRGMVRGLGAAVAAADAAAGAGAGARSALAAAADAWADRGGGTSGALWGVALNAWAAAYSDTEAVTAAATASGARAAVDAVRRMGGAVLGDKTMVDAMVPFADALEQALAAGADLADAWGRAVSAASAAAEATAGLLPRIGRARPLAERSLGHRDAGAVSFVICAGAVGRVLEAGR